MLEHTSCVGIGGQDMMKTMAITPQKRNKMKPTNPNAHTYVNGTDVKTHGYAVTHNTFLQ